MISSKSFFSKFMILLTISEKTEVRVFTKKTFKKGSQAHSTITFDKGIQALDNTRNSCSKYYLIFKQKLSTLPYTKENRKCP